MGSEMCIRDRVHADAAFAVALFTRNGGLTEERLRLACAGLQKVRGPTSKVKPYAHNEPPRPRTVRREKLLGTEEATHWLADVAAEARPYHPRFRFEHRTRFSGIVLCANQTANRSFLGDDAAVMTESIGETTPPRRRSSGEPRRDDLICAQVLLVLPRATR